MADLASITTAITAVKTALDITKTIGDIDKDFQKSELKIKIIELREHLFNAKNELLDVKELLQEKDLQIEELLKTVSIKPLLIRKDGCYFDKDELEKDCYEPFCSQCWEVRNLSVHLIKQNSILLSGRPIRLLSYYCPNCKNPYQITQRLS